jgi:hypothetical protein
MKPYKWQSKRTYEQKRNYNISGAEIPFYLWSSAPFKKLTAEAALHRLVLNLFCTKRTLLHNCLYEIRFLRNCSGFLVDLVEPNAYLLAHPSCLHRYPEKHFCHAHRALGVGDYYKL